jgi:cytochrome c-type biogenesis protein CcmH
LADRIKNAEDRRANRPSQATAEAGLPPRPVDPSHDENYVALVDKLRATVAQRPDDVQGHMLLAQSESNLGNFGAAHVAQRTAIDLKGANASIADLTDYADMMVLAAGGYVSPEAESVLRAVLARDAGNGPARYYMGLTMLQTGRPDVAFRVWDQLLRIGPADAPWIAPIKDQIVETASSAGINYQIPTIGNGAGPALRGPSADDIDAAGEMSGAERIEMIEGMVAGLSDRLATQGGPPEEWAQLIGALGVLGRRDQAAAIYANAIDVFGDNPSAMDLLTRAGQRAGVAE